MEVGDDMFLREEEESEGAGQELNENNENGMEEDITEGNSEVISNSESEVEQVDVEVSFVRTPVKQRKRDEGRRQHNNSNRSDSTEIKRLKKDYSDNKEYDDIEERSMLKFTKFLEKKGFITQSGGPRKDKRKKMKNGNTSHIPLSIQESNSETTIYQNAVPLESEVNQKNQERILALNHTNKRGSSSSEDGLIDTSDELINNEIGITCTKTGKEKKSELYQRFLDCRLKEQREHVSRKNRNDSRLHQPQPSTSRAVEDPRLDMEEKARQMIRQAEAAKATMYEVSGENNLFSGNELFHSVLVDEDYSIIGNHLDESTKQKIIEGAYVDFVKLIPRERINVTEDQKRMEIVVRNGQTFFQPVAERENVSINSINKWEQAFRVYSTIYAGHYPRRSTELLQYSHIIHYACQYYSWDNVYSYDKDFRLHMAKHPNHNWGIILQQAWSMRLQDKINNHIANRGYFNQTQFSGSGSISSKKCWKFNKGKCMYGFNCKFDHRCGVCNKFGHGAHNCRKGNGKGGDRYTEKHEKIGDKEVGEYYEKKFKKDFDKRKQ